MSDVLTAAYVAMCGSFETGWRDVDRLRRVYPEDVAIALAAADKARAVTDEEVLNVLENSRTYADALTALHAAGMKVVRA